MNYKILACVLLSIIFVYELVLRIIDYRSFKNEIPTNVKDIYDEKTYQKWMAYHKETSKLDIVSCVISFSIYMTFIATNFYAFIANLIDDNPYVQMILVLAIYLVTDFVLSSIFTYISSIIIEEKYGFNKMTRKTFISDRLKSLIVSSGLIIGLMSLFVLIHQSLGDWIILLFSGILVVIIFLVLFLYPIFSKLFNKFTPLEDGTLKTKLTDLLSSHGYHVKGIMVMDASRRTTKSNAYFTGFGKMKTIVLYDNLLNTMDEDEICAIFAHEMGHGLHKDTLKSGFLNIVLILIIVLLAWLTVRYPAIYYDFGFKNVNYGFGLILLTAVEMSIVMPLLEIVSNSISRTAEFRADEQAVKEGYGEALISSFKKLYVNDLANLCPSKVIVFLKYTHPTLSQRIESIEQKMNQQDKTE